MTRGDSLECEECGQPLSPVIDDLGHLACSTVGCALLGSLVEPFATDEPADIRRGSKPPRSGYGELREMRGLFVRYIATVGRAEGVDFIDDMDLTHQEARLMEALARESEGVEL